MNLHWKPTSNNLMKLECQNEEQKSREVPKEQWKYQEYWSTMEVPEVWRKYWKYQKNARNAWNTWDAQNDRNHNIRWEKKDAKEKKMQK